MYPTTNYFYIIEHIQSGLLYAGSKYSTLNTGILWKEYFTSSELISNIVENCGTESFRIVEVKSDFSDFNYEGKLPKAFVYEQNFLRVNNCRKSNGWLNGKSIKNVKIPVKLCDLDYFKIFDKEIFFITLRRNYIDEYVTSDNLKKFCKLMKLSYTNIVRNFINGSESEYELILSPNDQIRITKLIDENRKFILPELLIGKENKKIDAHSPKIETRYLRRVEYNGRFVRYEYI